MLLNRDRIAHMLSEIGDLVLRLHFRVHRFAILSLRNEVIIVFEQGKNGLFYIKLV